MPGILSLIVNITLASPSTPICPVFWTSNSWVVCVDINSSVRDGFLYNLKSNAEYVREFSVNDSDGSERSNSTIEFLYTSILLY